MSIIDDLRWRKRMADVLNGADKVEFSKSNETEAQRLESHTG